MTDSPHLNKVRPRTFSFRPTNNMNIHYIHSCAACFLKRKFILLTIYKYDVTGITSFGYFIRLYLHILSKNEIHVHVTAITIKLLLIFILMIFTVASNSVLKSKPYQQVQSSVKQNLVIHYHAYM